MRGALPGSVTAENVGMVRWWLVQRVVAAAGDIRRRHRGLSAKRELVRRDESCSRVW